VKTKPVISQLGKKIRMVEDPIKVIVYWIDTHRFDNKE